MVPFTYYYGYRTLDEQMRQTVMAEFAASGAKHLVLSDALLSMIDGDPKLYLTLQKEMRDAGLTFVDAHSPFAAECDIGLPVPECRQQMIARAKFNLRVIRDFGVNTCCFHIKGRFYPGYNMRQVHDAARDSLEKLLPLAEELDVTICLENIFSPGNTVGEVLSLIEEFPSKNLGACFDIGHANIMEHGKGNPECVAYPRWEIIGESEPVWEEDVLTRMLPHIVNCHLHDNHALVDEHDLPGHGTVDWERAVKILRTAPRIRNIQSEVIPAKNRIPIRELVGTFKKLGFDNE